MRRLILFLALVAFPALGQIADEGGGTTIGPTTDLTLDDITMDDLVADDITADDVTFDTAVVTSNTGPGVDHTGTGIGFRTAAASGTNGFACTTNGCRVDFGAGSDDYCVSSSGTTIACGAGVINFSLNDGQIWTSATNGGLRFSGVAGKHYLQSATNASTMTSTVPAWDIVASATPDADDRLVCFGYGDASSGGTPTRVACIDEDGDFNGNAATFAASVTVASGFNLEADRLKVGNSNGTVLTTIASNTATLDFPDNAATYGCDDLQITVTGAAVNGSCIVGPPAAVVADGNFTCYVSATNTVEVRHCGPGNPASATFRATVINH